MYKESDFWIFMEERGIVERYENNKPYRITIKEIVSETKKYENWTTFRKEGKNALMFFAEHNPLVLQALHKNPHAKKIWAELSDDGRSLLDYFLLSTKRRNCESLSYNNYELCKSDFINKLSMLSFKKGPAYFDINNMLGDLTFTEKMIEGSMQTSRAYMNLFENINKKSDNCFLFGDKSEEIRVTEELKKNIILLKNRKLNSHNSVAENMLNSIRYMIIRGSDDNIKNLSEPVTEQLISFLRMHQYSELTIERITKIRIQQEKEKLSDFIQSEANLSIKNRL